MSTCAVCGEPMLAEWPHILCVQLAIARGELAEAESAADDYCNESICAEGKLDHTRFMAAGWRRKYRAEFALQSKIRNSQNRLIIDLENARAALEAERDEALLVASRAIEVQERVQRALARLLVSGRDEDAEAMGGLWGLAAFGHAVYFGEVARRAYTFVRSVADIGDNPTKANTTIMKRAGYAVVEIMLKVV